MNKTVRKSIALFLIFILTVINYGVPIKAIAIDTMESSSSLFGQKKLEFKAYFDDDCYGKGQAAVMQHIMLVELGLLKFYQQGSFSVIDQEYIFHLYSRELEHSTDNYDEFIESLRTESMCNYENLNLIRNMLYHV